MKFKFFVFFTLLSAASFAQKVGTDIGDKAPEIEMADTDGKMVKLSSIEDQYVLIDFWASWCGPCRHENPHVLAAYEEYKDYKFKAAKEGFTVFAVSFDNNKEKWLKAIDEDGLVYPYHVSDLRGWGNAAGIKYGIRGIPANFLIDPDGIIVAKNLRGDALEDVLKKLKKK